VSRPSKKITPDRLRAGWALLAEGRWEAARASFAEALALGETPEALEGLSWAAWWLDDAEWVFEARERAYRLYRRHGDAAAAARMALQELSVERGCSIGLIRKACVDGHGRSEGFLEERAVVAWACSFLHVLLAGHLEGRHTVAE